MSEEDIGTVRWWGLSWNAPVNDPRAEIPFPVGAFCKEESGGCGFPIVPGDSGVSIPYLAGEYQHFHRECFLRMIGLQVTREVFGE